jgi:hypothetical protein
VVYQAALGQPCLRCNSIQGWKGTPLEDQPAHCIKNLVTSRHKVQRIRQTDQSVGWPFLLKRPIGTPAYTVPTPPSQMSMAWKRSEDRLGPIWAQRRRLAITERLVGIAAAPTSTRWRRTDRSPPICVVKSHVFFVFHAATVMILRRDG